MLRRLRVVLCRRRDPLRLMLLTALQRKLYEIAHVVDGSGVSIMLIRRVDARTCDEREAISIHYRDAQI